MLRFRPLWVILIGAATLVGGLFGLLVGSFMSSPVVVPPPHHFSKYPDGLSLRFAMVHDMIHERFPKHGQAYYEARNRLVQQQLDELKDADVKKRADLLDDLGAGLERLGRHEEAVALMRKKLQDQLDAKQEGRDLYASYANLGTFLILWQLQEGFADKVKAKARLQEGLGYVHKSIEVNPEAHFGREIWQAVILEFLIAALDDPQLIVKFDFIGNRLDANIDPRTRRSMDASWIYATRSVESASDAESVARYRSHITPVGAEEEWSDVKTSQPMPTPFDESTLGIIGMWRLGSGANPYFAIALGEIMLRVGQRYIAWTAFERAAQMAGGIWPDPAIQEQILAHCRARQALIESGLPDAEVAALRPRFTKELAFGQRYQREYQEYEAAQIARGVSIDDPKFHDSFDFEARHGPIVSPIGPEEQFMVVRPRTGLTWRAIPAVLFFAGLPAFIVAGLLTLVERLWPSPKPPQPIANPFL